MLSGNALVARGALDAGCTFFSGYPITPSSEIYSEMMRWLPRRGGLAVGAPDEISALSYAVGASMAGARAMTATSGPGWSLMIETVQFAVMTETPVVIAVVQRLGPATGGATQGAQGDVLFVAHSTSGGYPIPVLAPADPVDCHRLTVEAFRRSEILRTPVVLLSDKEVGMTVETVDLDALAAPPVEPRRAVREGAFVPYRVERSEDVPAFAPVGGPLKVTTTGSAHNERGELRKNDPDTIRQLRHLDAKVTARAGEMELVRRSRREGARMLVVSYGITARAAREAVRELEGQGVAVDLLEVLSLFPIPRRSIAEAVEGMRRVIVAEENGPGLYAEAIEPLLRGVEVARVTSVGSMIPPAAIAREVTR